MAIPFLKRNKGRFEFSFVDNVNLEQIESPAALISWVEQENARLTENESVGSVLIVKKNSKDVILFAKKLVLPVNEDTDFDELLYHFYAKKVVPFDQSILNPVVSEEPFIHPKIQEPEDEGYAAVPDLLEEQEVDILEDTNDQLSVENISYESEELFHKQAEEIQRLKAELADKSVSTTIEMEKNPNECLDKKYNENKDERTIEEPRNSYVVVERETVVSPVSFTAKSFDQRLSAFIEQELKNIDDEIKLVDKRSFIETDIREAIRQEEERMLQVIESTITNQKTEAIKAEELRHLKELEIIDQKYNQELKQQRIQTINDYKREEKDRITQEFTRQTKELKKIIEIRMNTLRERQEKLGGGLAQKLDDVLQSMQEGSPLKAPDSDSFQKQMKDPPLADRDKRMHA